MYLYITSLLIWLDLPRRKGKKCCKRSNTNDFFYFLIHELACFFFWFTQNELLAFYPASTVMISNLYRIDWLTNARNTLLYILSRNGRRGVTQRTYIRSGHFNRFQSDISVTRWLMTWYPNALQYKFVVMFQANSAFATQLLIYGYKLCLVSDTIVCRMKEKVYVISIWCSGPWPLDHSTFFFHLHECDTKITLWMIIQMII